MAVRRIRCRRLKRTFDAGVEVGVGDRAAFGERNCGAVDEAAMFGRGFEQSDEVASHFIQS
jgi:hypothetical protein